jgi:hypothetical protein
MTHWDTLATVERDGYTVVLETTWEDTALRDCFEESEFDLADLARQIDRGDLEWFVLRARALVDTHTLGESYLGGLLYEDPKAVLSDGVADEAVDMAVATANTRIADLQQKLAMLRAAQPLFD